MIDVASIKVRSRESPRRVDESGKRALAGACPRAWNVERGEGTVRSAHVAMIHIARVTVPSRNRTCRVEAGDCCGKGALGEGTSPRARSIERGDGTLRGAHEAVPHIVCVNVLSCSRACRVDVIAEGPTRAWHIERVEGAVRSAHVAVS